jgi:uncharacterized protein YkwD
VRGPYPSGGWSEPQRRPDDWTQPPAPDAEDPEAARPPSRNGRPPYAGSGHRSGNGHWPQEQELFPDRPWHSRPDEGAPQAGQPPGQAWIDDDEPLTDPWAVQPSQPWGRAAERPTGPAWEQGRGWAGDAPGEPFEAGPSLSQLWEEQPTSGALELAPSRPGRTAAPPVQPRRGRPGDRRRVGGRMALLIAIPLVVSLLLLATAGPGRVLPRKGAQDTAAKRPAAAPLQPGDTDRLVALVNRERARNGLPGLRVLRRLNAAAAEHAAEMARLKRIQPDPAIAARVRPATSVGQYVDCASNVDQAYRRMYASATYRPMILSPTLNGIGLGTVSGNCLWVTVLFARATPPASASKSEAPVGGGPVPAARTAPARPAAVRAAPGRPSTTAQAIAKDLFARVGAERKARGLPPLAWSDDLARMASDWSSQMARTGQFVHRDLDAARGRPGIGQFSALGENIAWVRGYDDDGHQLHLGWMRSEGHRRNLLQPGFDTIGIGVVCAGGRAWAAENFGRLSPAAPPLSESTPPTEPIVATGKDGLSC